MTGLGFAQTQGVIFFGGNRSEEDTLVTDSNAGLFMGMMADSPGGILAQCNSVIPRQGQRSSGTQPILMQSSFNTVEYAASPTSLDPDGFTVTFTSVPLSGSRWIHYLAWGDFEASACSRVTQSAATVTVGFAAQCAFCVSTVSYGGGPGDWIRPDLPEYTFATWGGGKADTGAFTGYAFLATARTAGLYGQGWQVLQEGTNWTGMGAFFIGPFLGQVPLYAYHVPPDQMYLDNAANIVNSSLFAYWTGPATSGVFSPSASAGGTVVEPLTYGIELPEAMIVLGCMGREDFGDFLNPDNGMSFGVVTDDYQGCVAANMGGNYFFQSRTTGFVSQATAAGVNAGTIVLNDDYTFTATTTQDDVSPAPLDYVAFGPGEGEEPSRPQIYRWVTF